MAFITKSEMWHPTLVNIFNFFTVEKSKIYGSVLIHTKIFLTRLTLLIKSGRAIGYKGLFESRTVFTNVQLE
jgi:hypothetical protein